jgi:hypothetical protein
MDMRNGMMNGTKNPYGEVSMKMKMPKLHNPAWKRRVSLVLIFTLMLSMISPGLYGPQKAHAAVTYVSAGTIGYSATNGRQPPAYRLDRGRTFLSGSSHEAGHGRRRIGHHACRMDPDNFDHQCRRLRDHTGRGHRQYQSLYVL